MSKHNDTQEEPVRPPKKRKFPSPTKVCELLPGDVAEVEGHVLICVWVWKIDGDIQARSYDLEKKKEQYRHADGRDASFIVKGTLPCKVIHLNPYP